MEWQKLQEVHEKAKNAAVSYSMHYAEVDDSWYFSISSIAPSENWLGKNHSFDIAVQCVLEWLDSLLAPNVEVTGAARLYRAASVWTAGLGH